MPPLRHMCQNSKKDETPAVAVKQGLNSPSNRQNSPYSTATYTERLAIVLLEGAVDLALDIALGHILALVVKLLAAA